MLITQLIEELEKFRKENGDFVDVYIHQKWDRIKITECKLINMKYANKAVLLR